MGLLERDKDLTRLYKLYIECRTGNGNLAVITGPAGSGKTYLLNVLAERVVAHGGQFVGASGSYAERYLPLGLMDLVFHNADLPDEAARRAKQLLGDEVLGALLASRPSPAGTGLPAHVKHSLFLTLADAAQRHPLVLGIDDLHLVDPASVECLSYLAEQLHRVRILLVVTEATPAVVEPPAHRGLVASAQIQRLSLEPLSIQAVHNLVHELLGARAAEKLAQQCHAISGGNPLVARALIDDCRTQGTHNALVPRANGAFGQAYTHCLDRCDKESISIARCLAVLGESATPSRLAELCGLSKASVTRAVRSLNATGLLTGGLFRHDAARLAVLRSLPREERAALHARAAELLRRDDEDAHIVADHLLGATDTYPSWAVPVLHEAAERALADGDVERTFRCLRLAQRIGRDAGQRALTTAMLATAQWRMAPAVASRHLGELVAAVRSGSLKGRHALVLIDWMLWFGQLQDAVDLLDHVEETAGGDDLAALYAERVRLAHLCPWATVGLLATQARTPAPVASTAVFNTWATQVLDGVSKDALATAGEQLRQQGLTDETWPALYSVLNVLVFGDHLDTAEPCCEYLLNQATAQRAVTWQAMLTATKAQIALRNGDLPRAELEARAALGLLSPKSWGIAIGVPLTVLVRANTAMGRTAVAHGYLRVPVPDTMFQTTIGLHYLEARGVYYRTTGRFSAALSDFTMCGDLITAWRSPLPVYWRLEAAKTYVRLGQPRQARELAMDQLMVADRGGFRLYGACLRVLAATHPPARRVALLEQAVKALHHSGDRIELAHTLTDLAAAQEELGQPARALSRRAREVARECGLSMSSRSTQQEGAPAAMQLVSPDDGRDATEELSEAERRVVFLATQGLTNRQVASKLSITVSTVEQHLTRVYRKLHVRSRADLPAMPRSVS